MNVVRIAAALAVLLIPISEAQARHHHKNRLIRSYDNMRSIPNPEGTWRVKESCAQRLAAYWGLGSGLDKVSTWPDRFERVSGPSPGIAAVRRDRHHVLGIVGGAPGAWEVVDFNSDGHHGNLAYVTAAFPGYFFVNPHAPRFANR